MTPSCFKSEKGALYPKGLGKAFLGDLKFCASENVVISVHVNQKEVDLFLQNIVGLTNEKQGEFLIRKTIKTTTTLPERPVGPQPRASPHPSPTR